MQNTQNDAIGSDNKGKKWQRLKTIPMSDINYIIIFHLQYIIFENHFSQR